MKNIEQLIFIGNECRLADPGNSTIPDWPVQDQEGYWHHAEFEGQRVALDQNSVSFGFLARLMGDEEIADLPGDVFCIEGQYYRRLN